MKSTQIGLLKSKHTLHKSPMIQEVFAKPKTTSRRELSLVHNIEYLDVAVNLRLARIYDRLMNREIFETMFEDLDHHNVFEEYRIFNEQFYEKLRDVVTQDDLIVVNDSSLFCFRA
ncbi:uncharacterized protein VICG_02078 [Vittaforma corneae ATCC 50505]|uniref:Uncharacterized protein n=1 Tax=Vittaforma corneae (strain ATCC 50505) TaxID=993615 RepID=L2GJ39_VITCO|nr:uncharacterized protein VICG_02078 [Vittaforma corneae ATCC 50505]ELA40898.1 hypothetical protein VICG_02078 [Vittaforma corneae ATCC 50505]